VTSADRQSGRRVVYVATGERHIGEVGDSLRSLWRHEAGMPVSLHVDRDHQGSLERLGVPAPQRPDLLEIHDVPNPTYSWSDKPIALAQGGPDGEDVLFLDTDTRICGGLEEIFELLGPFDLAAAHAPIRLDRRQPGDVAGRVPSSFPELNTGVVAFRRTRAVAELIDRWRHLHIEILGSAGPGGVGDQAAFRIALFHSGLRFSVLTPEFNCRFGFPTYLQGPVRILHGRGPSLERIERELNESTGPRVYVPGMGVLRATADARREV
jgi:hypothetical protein